MKKLSESNSKHIVKYIESFEDLDLIYLAIEFIDGMTLE